MRQVEIQYLNGEKEIYIVDPKFVVVCHINEKGVDLYYRGGNQIFIPITSIKKIRSTEAEL